MVSHRRHIKALTKYSLIFADKSIDDKCFLSKKLKYKDMNRKDINFIITEEIIIRANKHTIESGQLNSKNYLYDKGFLISVLSAGRKYSQFISIEDLLNNYKKAINSIQK